eukprot:TRINITY_DN13206_c0_g1_i1.p4 TRINITY_DN13206_c0_g1~~TRINITY_DN13206_c0_g1_i1.p4  ORF type:complete len:182 (-),score=1.11 TRINITY_DN13206_c0_g1_i1:1615-2133(-)
MSNIEFVLPKSIKEKPILTIYNLKGQKVKRISLENSYQDMQRHAGLKTNYADGQLYSTNWNLRNENNKQVASRLYFIQVKAGGYSASSKIMVLKQIPFSGQVSLSLAHRKKWDLLLVKAFDELKIKKNQAQVQVWWKKNKKKVERIHIYQQVTLKTLLIGVTYVEFSQCPNM